MSKVDEQTSLLVRWAEQKSQVKVKYRDDRLSKVDEQTSLLVRRAEQKSQVKVKGEG